MTIMIGSEMTVSVSNVDVLYYRLTLEAIALSAYWKYLACGNRAYLNDWLEFEKEFRSLHRPDSALCE